MKRAKHPPDDETVAAAHAMLDLLESGWFTTEIAAIDETANRGEEGVTWQHLKWRAEGSARHEEWMAACQRRDDLVESAIAEYLRRFPRARNANGRVWQYEFERHRPLGGDAVSEVHYICFFCRTNLNTLPHRSGTLPPAFVNSLLDHCHKCAMRFLAGITTGKAKPRPRRTS